MRYGHIGFMPSDDELFYGTIILVISLLVGYILRISVKAYHKYKQ